MTLLDHRGDAVTGADAGSLGFYETALSQLNRYADDPLATIDRAIAEAPSFGMAHALRAYLLLSGMEKDFLPEAAASLLRLNDVALSPRERAHAAALGAFLRGELHEASRLLDALLVEHPRDLLALQMGHVLDFYRGDARNLRDRIGRVLPEWSADLPGYHAVLGMRAFGLEETGAYGAAEEAGRQAIALQADDAWAHHAVAHVLEMQGRVGEGAAFLGEGAALWGPGSFMAVHNWWHLALFRLEQDDVAGVLALYDTGVRGGQSAQVLEMIDASALLWRLHLRGVDVGARWESLADLWAPRLGDGLYAFNDAHAMMALIGSGRLLEAHHLLATLQRAALAPSANGPMTRDVGLPLARALLDLHLGRNEEVVAALLPLRSIASRFGGSHAQRDVIDLTLIEAAARAGQTGLLRVLANERLQHRPESPLARRYRQRAIQPLAA